MAKNRWAIGLRIVRAAIVPSIVFIALSALFTLGGHLFDAPQVAAAGTGSVVGTSARESDNSPFASEPRDTLSSESDPGRVGEPTVPGDADVAIVEPPPPAPELPHRPPVWLEVEASPAAAMPGDTVTLAIRIKVEADLADAVLTGTLPSGLDFLSAESDRVVYNATDRTVQWPLGQLRASDTPEFRLQLRINATAPDLMVQNIEVRVPGYSGPAVGQVVLKRLFPHTEIIVTPDAGGTLRSADSRVQVVFPPGASKDSLRIVHTPKRVDRIPLQAGGLGIEFDLKAYTNDAASTPIYRFDKPLELRVDMTGLLDFDSLAYWQYPYLAWYDEAKGQWVTLITHREGNILVASLDHFTTIGGGTGNNYDSGWLLAFSDAHVSTFTGALNYDFPIQVPEGRGGLTPDLRLNYNSRRVDGILTWIQTDWVGLGWTLDTMSIARRVTPNYEVGEDWKPKWYWGWVDWENKFTLLYKGTGYKLIPETTLACGRYHTEDEQFLYIERRNAASGCSSNSANETSEYWIVRLRDGTEYRLGYNTDSEQVVATINYTVPVTPTETTYAGDSNGQVAFQWRVDTITDVHGSTIEFSYYEETTTEGGSRDRASYLSEVEYNKLSDDTTWGTKVLFNRAARSSDAVSDTVEPDYQYYYFYQDDFLQSIKVENWDSGQYNTVREYLLTYDARTVPPEEHDNHTRRLVSITEYGTDGYGGDFLPTTTFTYTTHFNKDWCSSCPEGELWNREVFRYERLARIENGYGGVISLTYASPDTEWWHAWNYRVETKTVSETVSGDRSSGYQIAYSYTTSNAQRCYVHPTEPDAFGCYFFNPLSDTGGSLVGYGSVTETLNTLEESLVSVTVHESKLDTVGAPDRAKGHEIALYRKDTAGNDLQKITTTWAIYTTSVPTYFPYAQWVQEYIQEGSGLPANPQKKTFYAYEISRQNDAQYGNLTQILEYQGGTPYRQTLHYFYPNTTTWIVDIPGLTWLKVVTDGVSYSQTKTKYIYDDPGNTYSTPPERGDLVRKEQTVSVSPGDSWITTQAITYTDSTYHYLPYIVADGNGNQTTTTYDAIWMMYPLTVTNALSQATAYEYNYVLGKVKEVTGPNGAATATSYDYDEFGRLTKIIRPGDTTAFPTTKYEYCDTCAPLCITTTQRITSGAGGVDIPTLRFYNGLGQLIQENTGTTDDSQMTIANTTYNAQGLVDKSYVPYSDTYSIEYQQPNTSQPKTSYAYDALGRTTTVTNTDSTTVRTFYDGLTITVVDENSHQKVYGNDALGRLVTVKEYTGTYPSATLYATTTYTYNTLDLLTTVTDTTNSTTTMTYDALGRKTAMTDPDMGDWSYTYDNAGNLTRQTDARGQRMCFYYDALNRLTGKHYRSNDSCPAPADPQLAAGYSYDATADGNLGIGYRTAMSDTVSGNTAWKYDTRGRVIEEIKVITGTGGPFTTTWAYNAADMVVAQVYPGTPAETATTTYDKWGRASTLTGSSDYVTNATYDALGRPDVIQFGNGQRTDYDYYAMTQDGGRLYEIKTGSPSPYTGTQYLRYDYDSAGNVVSITDLNNLSQVQSFTYDSLDRLTAASTDAYGADQYSDTYSYSTIGNLTEKSGLYYYYSSTRPQAVRSVIGDLNSAEPYTVTIRARGIPDTENPTMTLRVNGILTAAWSVAGDGMGAMMESGEPTGDSAVQGGRQAIQIPDPIPQDAGPDFAPIRRAPSLDPDSPESEMMSPDDLGWGDVGFPPPPVDASELLASGTAVYASEYQPLGGVSIQQTTAHLGIFSPMAGNRAGAGISAPSSRTRSAMAT